MNKAKRQTRRWYGALSYGSLILAILYLLVTQMLIRLEVAPNGGLPLITGRARVVVSDDILTLHLKSKVHQIVLSFNQPLAGQVFLANPVQAAQYEVKWDPEMRHSVTIQASSLLANKAPEGFSAAVFSVGRLFSTPDFSEREIVAATVDGRSLTPYDFLTKILIRDESSVSLYYPFALQNISRECAHAFGNLLIYGILGILLLLAIAQILLLLGATWAQPESVSFYFSNRATNEAVTFVDSVASDYAIPLGLLGTITSIWVALEQPSINFASFEQILGTLRLAVFTTVLGLVIKIVCMIRGRIGLARGVHEQS